MSRIRASAAIGMTGGARARLARAVGHGARFRGRDRLIRLIYSPDRRLSDFVIAETKAWDGTLYLTDTRTFLEWSLYVYGAYERPLQALMFRLVPPGGVVVDCGANIGIHTCALARRVGRSGRVVAVEPVAELADRLERNLLINHLDNVLVARVAVGAVEGESVLHLPDAEDTNQGLASLSPQPQLTRTRAVPVRRLDDVAAEVGLERVDLVKLDIEGHEIDALTGCPSILSRSRPVLVLEFSAAHAADARAAWGALWDLLVVGHRYRLTESTAAGLVLLERDAVPRTSVVVAMPLSSSTRSGVAPDEELLRTTPTGRNAL